MEKLAYGIIALIILAMAFLLVDVLGAKKAHPIRVVVIDRVYTPAKASTGVGTGVMSNGKVGTVVTTSYSAEKWKLIADNNGTVITVNATPEQWAVAEKGMTILVSAEEGLITRANYGYVATF